MAHKPFEICSAAALLAPSAFATPYDTLQSIAGTYNMFLLGIWNAGPFQFPIPRWSVAGTPSQRLRDTEQHSRAIGEMSGTDQTYGSQRQLRLARQPQRRRRIQNLWSAAADDRAAQWGPMFCRGATNLSAVSRSTDREPDGAIRHLMRVRTGSSRRRSMSPVDQYMTLMGQCTDQRRSDRVRPWTYRSHRITRSSTVGADARRRHSAAHDQPDSEATG